jgi:hypothetical protein
LKLQNYLLDGLRRCRDSGLAGGLLRRFRNMG